jgi:hypothetical protein
MCQIVVLSAEVDEITCGNVQLTDIGFLFNGRLCDDQMRVKYLKSPAKPHYRQILQFVSSFIKKAFSAFKSQ